MKRIFVPILGDDKDKIALEGAAKLAGHDGAHIDVRLVLRNPADVLPYVGEGIGATEIATILEQAQKNTDKLVEIAEKIFKVWCKDNKIDIKADFEFGRSSAHFSVKQGQLPTSIVPFAQFADVSIFAVSNENDNADRREIFLAAVFESGRPALIVPQNVPDQIGKRIIVAWNASTESARAVAESMALLKHAEAVYVVTVDDQNDEYQGAELAETLKQNGIAATSVNIKATGSGVSATLASEAEKVSADMIIIGAYSHTRLREMVFGGVTQDLHDHPTVPVLMIH